MSVRKGLYTSLLLVSGILIGVVISGRMSARQGTPDAAPVEPQRGRGPAASSAPLPGLPDLTAVAERALKASVNISSTQNVQVNPWFQLMYGGGSVRQQTSLGSGVIVDADGYVLTNSHVVGDMRAQIKVTLPNDEERTATIRGIDPLTDLAVVKIEGGGFSPLPWGDSEALKPAEWVVAVGNPFSFNQTVTVGVVSALRHNAAGLSSAYRDFIQTDAAINPGNSGGALVNSRGELVGINTLIINQGQNLGFAVPSSLARPVMEDLKTKGVVTRGSIGNLTFRTLEPRVAQRAGLGDTRGVVVYDLYTADSAYRAGIAVEDVIVKYDGHDVTEDAQLERLIADSKIGSTVKVEVLRQVARGRFERRTITVPVIQQRPMTAGR